LDDANEYRKQIQDHLEAGTIHELGNLTINGSQLDTELSSQSLDSGNGIDERLSADNTTTR